MAIQEVMKREHKARSGIALGGIGAGWFELRKDGQFYNWNLFNNAPFGSGPAFELAHDSMLFFIVRFQVEGEEPRMKLLQIDEGYEVAAIPSHYYTFPWLTGVDEADYTASYPFTWITFRDEDMPLEVDLEAFTPFIPHDVKNSSLPAALFNFRVRSKTTRPVDVMLMASMRNGVGYDVPERHYTSRTGSGRGYKLFEMSCDGMDESHISYGAQAVASLAGDSTWYLGWEHRHPYYEYVIRNRKLPNHDDTEGRNTRDTKTGRKRAMSRLFSTIAVSRTLKKRESFDHAFVTSWHFPNLYSGQTPKAQQRGDPHEARFEGHYYDNFFDDASDVARYVIRHRHELTERTRGFRRDFFDSTAPGFVLDQVNSHLNTFVTSAWLTKAGDFGIQEGMTPEKHWGPLATIDVGMYGSVSAAALFPDLHKSMMRAHMRLRNTETGSICHGIGRDFTVHDVNEQVTDRLDLPSQYVIMTLRDYFWTGDRAYLKEVWPSVIEALEYVLRDRDPNGDLLPDMGGSMCTYDNFPMYGAASYVASLWLAALAYAAEAAPAAGDDPAGERYADILEKAVPVFEEKLYTGEYYRLYNDEGPKPSGPGDRDDACLTDQIIGQWAMHFAGLGDLFPRTRIRKALRKIVRTCYQPDYGLLNCRWPGDEFLHPVDPNCWSDQANTCWSGVELAFASFLIYEGMVRDGLKVIRNVDDRYRKAGMYFDHQEFGGHYYRPMSAWAIVNALLGLSIDRDRYEFAPRLRDADQKLFFSFGAGTGHYLRKATGKGEKITLDVRSGKLRCKELRLGLAGKDYSRCTVRAAGKALPAGTYEKDFANGELTLRFDRAVTIPAGDQLRVTVS